MELDVFVISWCLSSLLEGRPGVGRGIGHMSHFLSEPVECPCVLELDGCTAAAHKVAFSSSPESRLSPGLPAVWDDSLSLSLYWKTCVCAKKSIKSKNGIFFTVANLVPPLTFTCYMRLDTSLSLFKPDFNLLRNGKNSTCFTELFQGDTDDVGVLFQIYGTQSHIIGGLTCLGAVGASLLVV